MSYKSLTNTYTMMLKPIDCKAAVAWGPNQPLSIETVTVDAPRYGEVRIKILYASVCHTDQYTLSGADPEGNFPCILGHEGSGIVEAVGPGVQSVQVKDHVIPLYMPQCKQCQYCQHPKTNLCSKIRETQCRGLMPDGTVRFLCKGRALYHYMGCSTFSEYTVVPEIAVAKVDRHAPLDRICLLGCGFSTGYGAALNTANVQKGDTVAIWGLGTVGLAVAWGCKKRGARRVIGIDVNETKFELSKSFGVTHTVNPTRQMKTIQNVLIEMTGGGPDHTFECVGNVDTMRQALESCHKGWGQSIIIGVAAAGREIATRPFNLICGRTWKGCAFGGWKSRDSVPLLASACLRGELPLDWYVTDRRADMEDLNGAFDQLISGNSLRCVIRFAEEGNTNPYLQTGATSSDDQ